MSSGHVDLKFNKMKHLGLRYIYKKHIYVFSLFTGQLFLQRSFYKNKVFCFNVCFV